MDVREHSRQLWLLFVDTNVRANIMLDDASSLQQLTLRLVDNRELLSEMFAAGGVAATTNPRPWTVPHHTLERRFGARDRALVEIWRMLGNAAGSIEIIQAAITDAFTTAIYAEGETRDREIARFVLIRRQMIGAKANSFLKRLRLAREKLAQFLENRPGALPAPLSQRRWANSMYVDFLGSYSFRVRREVTQLCRMLTTGQPLTYLELEALDDELLDKEDSLHGIAYASASETTSAMHGAAGKAVRQIIAQSSYFYPEQPTLLPLLYHEFAHHYMARSSEASWHGSEFDNYFVKRVGTIGQAMLHERTTGVDQYSDKQVILYWETILDELKADTIAIALSGVDYLHALTLGLIGQESVWLHESTSTMRGDVYEDHFRESTTSSPRLDNPAATVAILRLWYCAHLAIRLGKNDNADAFQTEYPNSVFRFCTSYLRGLELLAPAKTEGLWRAFVEQISVLSRQLEVMAADVEMQFGGLLRCGAANSASLVVKAPHTVAALEKFISAYASKVVQPFFGGEPSPCPTFTLPASSTGYCRVDAAPLRVRWYLSHWVRVVAGPFGTMSKSDFQTRIATAFASYARNDGSVAFRYLLEMLLGRRHLFREVAGMIETNGSQISPLGVTTTDLDEFKRQLQSELDANPALRQRIGRYRSGATGAAATNDELLGTWLSSPLHEETFDHASGQPAHALPCSFVGSSCAISKYLQSMDAQLAASLEVLPGDEQFRFALGMFELGTLSPDARTRSTGGPSDTQSLGECWRETREQLKFSKAGLEARCDPHKVVKRSMFGQSIARLHGEYHYASILWGSTPVERDCVVGLPLRSLAKPRFVLAVKTGGNQEQLLECSQIEIKAVTLIRLRHRHHWSKLQSAVLSRLDPTATLFLSTGWETGIIVWRTPTADAFWQGTKALSELGDTHTLIVVPGLLRDDQAAAVSTETFEKLAATQNTSDSLNLRTGRYDTAKVFHDLTARELADHLDQLSGISWSKIEKISVEARVDLEPTVAGNWSATVPKRGVSTRKPQGFDWMLRKMDRRS